MHAATVIALSILEISVFINSSHAFWVTVAWCRIASASRIIVSVASAPTCGSVAGDASLRGEDVGGM